MKVTVAANGSRGDVQPLLALARELRRRDHDVVVGVPVNLLPLARSCGVDAREFAPDTADLLASPVVARDLRSRDPRTRSRAIREVAEFGAATMDDRLLEMADGADVVVTGPLGQERGATVAEHHGARFTPVHFCPIRPNRAMRVPLGPLQAIPPGRLTGAMWWAVDRFYWRSSARGADDALRGRLGMRPADGPLGGRLAAAGLPEIQAYEPGLVGELADEWGDLRPLVGFVDLVDDTPEARVGATEIDDWIDDGDPPVYVGFGSMPLRDPVASYGHLLDAIAPHGRRVLLCAGPNGPAARDAVAAAGPAVEVRVTDAVDHRRVLPRCVVAIHHGGAGTTAACLRAGTPMIIASFSADQPLWGRIVAERGLGATLPVRALGDAPRLRAALATALTDTCTNSARSFAAEMIDVRDSVGRAADITDGTAGSRL
ncbi:glycosyltransferase [uncultured Williamsia sp.]|uniref:glycosyltransferase n=1 Tax=uncultured Williamsia sp. TaxID=259311 RepID=UPI00262074EB|nr:glycosyltransferase [uncultured Williamsia sp.]